MSKKNSTQQATAPQKSVELLATEEAIFSLRDQIAEIDAAIKTETRAAENARDGFDKYQPGSGPLVADLARHGVPAERAQTFANWQRTRLVELTTARSDAKRQLDELTKAWQGMHTQFQHENAGALHAETATRIEALRQQISEKQQAQHDLRQRIGQITSTRLQRAELSETHDQAAAAALAAGLPVPQAPELPDLPGETVPQLESAIGLIGQQIEDLRVKLEAAQHERRALGNMISGHRADMLMVEVRALAKEGGVSLADIRDRLVLEVGETALSEARSAGEARAQFALQAAEAKRVSVEAALTTANNRLSAHSLMQVGIQADEPTAGQSWGVAASWPQQSQNADALFVGRI